MEDATKQYLDKQFAEIHARIDVVSKGLARLDDSINKTEDETKPSLRQALTLLRLRVEAIEGNAGKLWALLGATPLSLLVAYAMAQIFWPHGSK